MDALQTKPEHDNPVDIFFSRWRDLVRVLPNLAEIPVFAEEGYSSHFESPRGYAVTREEARGWVVVFAPKIKMLPITKREAIVRHELGHVLDFSVPKEAMDRLAETYGVRLPDTIERRADALAELAWGDRISYDEDMVQTLDEGIHPRPEALGL